MFAVNLSNDHFLDKFVIGFEVYSAYKVIVLVVVPVKKRF